jgi:hypothetical protein
LPILAKWLLLWLRAKKIPALTDEEIVSFLIKGNKCGSEISEKIKLKLHDEHVKMLNLGHDWLTSYLPFVLQKVNRVHFGLLQPHDIKLLEDQDVKIPTSRKLVAVPFVAKDVPSRSVCSFYSPQIIITYDIFSYESLEHRNSLIQTF